MSPLDAVRQLEHIDPWCENERAGLVFCIACGAYEDHTGRHHARDCPLLAVPRIVAVIEAAQALVDLPDARVIVHTDWAEYQALVAALKGEEVRA